MRFHAARVAAGIRITLELLVEADRQGRTCIGMVPHDDELIVFFSSKDCDEPGSAKPVESCCNAMVSAIEAGFLHVSSPSRIIGMSRELPGKSLYTSIKFCPWCSAEIR